MKLLIQFFEVFNVQIYVVWTPRISLVAKCLQTYVPFYNAYDDEKYILVLILKMC